MLLSHEKLFLVIGCFVAAVLVVITKYAWSEDSPARNVDNVDNVSNVGSDSKVDLQAWSHQYMFGIHGTFFKVPIQVDATQIVAHLKSLPPTERPAVGLYMTAKARDGRSGLARTELWHTDAATAHLFDRVQGRHSYAYPKAIDVLHNQMFSIDVSRLEQSARSNDAFVTFTLQVNGAQKQMNFGER